MDDRALLEAAAKAAGNGAVWYQSLGMGIDTGSSIPTLWRPLTDDGAAFRLAVKLRIDIELSIVNSGFVHAEWWHDEKESYEYAEEVLGSDPYAATRRAIVRAAAAIGARAS